MAYKALTYINLPPDNRKAPGDTITEKELKDAGQGDEEIADLIKGGAMGDKDDPIHADHVVVPDFPPSNGSDVNIKGEETGGGKS